jgi:hypothetical protein
MNLPLLSLTYPLSLCTLIRLVVRSNEVQRMSAYDGRESVA